MVPTRSFELRTYCPQTVRASLNADTAKDNGVALTLSGHVSRSSGPCYYVGGHASTRRSISCSAVLLT